MFNIIRPRKLTALLPHTFTAETMYGLISLIIDDDLDSKNAAVEFDFSRLENIAAGGVAVLSNIIEFLRKSGVRVSCKNLDLSCKAYTFLLDAGFVHVYGYIKATKATQSLQILPLELVRQERAYPFIHSRLVPWLAAGLGCRDNQLPTIRVCFDEIFNNIRDHSTVNVGCLCANNDKRRKAINICISDFGIGIPANVRRKAPGITSDALAIQKACEQGFTTGPPERNLGAGLDTLIKNVVNINGGRVVIHSRRGIYSINKVGSELRYSPRSSQHVYPGTLVYVTLNPDQFRPEDANEEDFEW